MANNDCWDCVINFFDEKASIETTNSTKNASTLRERNMVVIPKEQIERCQQCNEPGKYLCARCHAVYCSPKCQSDHWRIHRYHCVPIPYTARQALNEAARMQAIRTKYHGTAQTKITSQIPSDTIVVISYVLDQNFVFIRPATGDRDIYFMKTLQDILKFAETAQPIEQPPQYGQILLASHENNYCRVFVSHVYGDSGFVIVAKLDFGDIVQVQASHLFALSVELQTRQILVRKIKLCKTDAKNVHQINYLLDLKENEQHLKFTYEGEWSPTTDCNLIIAGTDESINEKLAQLQIISSPITQMENNIAYDTALVPGDRIMIQAIKCKEIQGENIEMIILDISTIQIGFITCIESCELQNMLKHSQAIDDYCRKFTRSSYKPELLEICLALNFADYRWSRAVCIDEHHEEKALIHFIDTGRVDRISYMDLKQLPPEFTFDFVSASCCINGLADLMQSELGTDSLKNKLKVNKKIVFDSVRYNSVYGHYTCVVSDLKKMVEGDNIKEAICESNNMVK